MFCLNYRKLLRIVLQDCRLLSSHATPTSNLDLVASRNPTHDLREILTLNEAYPFAFIQANPSRTVVLDYSSPNIAKPFHAGHLRSTILGNFIANISTAMGHKVHRINYLGDWGTQCGVVLAAMELFGSEEELGKSPLKHLLDIYVKGSKLDETDSDFRGRVQETMRQLENGDQKLADRWSRIRQLSVDAYMTLYKRLGIEFNEIAGESQYVKGAREAAARLSAVKSSENLSDDDVRLLKSDGSSLYLSRDLAAILDRVARFNLDDMLYVVDNGQHDHFQHLIRLSKQFEELRNRNLEHVKFGRIRGLSTRKGKVVLLSDLLDEADENMKLRIGRSKYARPKPEEMEEVAHALALSVMFINDFRQHRQHDYQNAAGTLQQSEGDSGVFLQYIHARLCSLEANSGAALNLEADFSLLVEPEALYLLDHLLASPDAAQSSHKEYEPFHLVHYLFQHGRLVNKAFKALRVKDQPPEIAEARLGLFHAARLISRSFLKILGLTPLQAM